MIQHKVKELADAWKLKISPPAMGGWTDFAYGITLLFDHCGVKQPKKIGQEVITECFVSCGISSREVERQLDLFDDGRSISRALETCCNRVRSRILPARSSSGVL
ncbi:hypothetical protein AVEN_256970-1 [Araneus ventricosus]|uniref:Uncharacterized protein n=1 Tax=Araneus ventricosus TaxID=182803 RepID=A0A4Y2EDQ5_ARAVE|nr:hypothetical protein AVEN_256970-1 [Araneus ventricosus]